jgi:DUF971 family protein
MKNFYKLGIALLAFPVLAMAQVPSVAVQKITGAPVLDGVVDALWASVPANNIALPFAGTETPTLGTPGQTTWKAVWNDTAIFVLLQVTDDVYSPAYLAGTHSGETWMYDKPEIYFDVNPVKIDGAGASGGKPTGHYQIAPGFGDGVDDGTLRWEGVNGFAQKVTDPNYVAEYSFPISNLTDLNGDALDLTAPIGFDVTICDNDVADGGTVAPVRNRANWSNDGLIGESWNNMDGCSTITLAAGAPAADVTLQKVIGAPAIDGVIDAFWANVPANNIAKAFAGTETPTLGDLGQTTWKAVWNDTAIFVLLTVTDDVYSPAYLAGTHSGETWMYDKPEIYFDVNPVKIDGAGASGGKPTGHYQIAPGFGDGVDDGTLRWEGVNGFAQKVTDPNYVAEYSFPISNLTDLNGDALDLTAPIGFDVTICDNDVADGGTVAPVRNRANWSNDGLIGESWNNMDGCGTIALGSATVTAGGTAVQTAKVSTQSAYIAYDVLKFKGYDKAVNVEVYSVLGQKVLSAKNVNEVSVADLTKGMYIVRVNNGKDAFKVLR